MLISLLTIIDVAMSKSSSYSPHRAIGRKIHLRSSILFPVIELELRDQSQYKTAVPPYMGIRDARAFYESEGHACLSNNQ
eukprot:scaffold171727_cov25-Cyclotella_meneghiniana.AAC.1